MPEIYKIYNVEDAMVGDTEVWYIDHQRQSDGHTYRHAMPKSVIEWRAAEYGMDHTTPAGRQQIIDLVLHEPFMPAIDPQVLHRNSKGKRLSTDEVHLYNAPTRDLARNAHLSKLETTKANIAQVIWPQAGTVTSLQARGPMVHPMLQGILDHQPDQAGVESKTGMVTSIRVDLGLEPKPAPVQQPASNSYFNQAIQDRMTVVVKKT